YCLTCEASTNAKKLQEAVVIAKSTAKVAARAAVNASLQFVKGVVGTVAKTAMEMNQKTVMRMNPLLEFLYRSPSDIWNDKKNEILSLPGRFNNFINQIGVIFDPTGKKQVKAVSDFYFDFKYASPEEKGNKAAHVGIAVAITVAGHPE